MAKRGVINEYKNQSLCQWFALCTNHRDTTRRHPILGDVPICNPCNEKLDRMET